MKNCDLILTLLWLVVWVVTCLPPREKSKSTREFHKRTGEAIALNDLIKKYESEHQELYNEEIRDGYCLEWPNLGKKNLSNYCRKYLQHSVPSRATDDAVGTKIKKTLHYEKENSTFNNKIVIVKCNILRSKARCYYMTRTPEPNCVYALNCAVDANLCQKFTIINKHCDFEDKPFIKRRKTETFDKIYYNIGLPVANEECILEYELEHQQLLKEKGEKGKFISWPHVMSHCNLDLYCNQYIRLFVSHKNCEGIKGIWKTEKLHYQKLNTINEDINVITVKCQLSKANNQYYYLTRALEMNCVYSLLRNGRDASASLKIIFKYCNFEELKKQQTIQENDEIIGKDVSPKIEVKKEHDSLELLQFLPSD